MLMMKEERGTPKTGFILRIRIRTSKPTRTVQVQPGTVLRTVLRTVQKLEGSSP
jgi:hypothetical protein